MSLLSTTALTPFKVKAVWITLAVLGAIILGQAAYIYVQSGQVALAEAAKTTAEAATDKAITSRDAWKQKAIENAVAAKSWKAAHDRTNAALVAAQAENARQEEANATALANIEAQRNKAATEAATWRRNYERIVALPECTQALLALKSACPVGSY